MILQLASNYKIIVNNRKHKRFTYLVCTTAPHSVPVIWSSDIWSFWLWSLENVFPYTKFRKYGHFGYMVHFCWSRRGPYTSGTECNTTLTDLSPFEAGGKEPSDSEEEPPDGARR